MLLTGFDAFGGADLNVSQLVVDAIADAKPPGVFTAVLPTSYRAAESEIQRLILTHKPKRVLMLGLANEANGIILEQAALNLNDCTAADNDGEVRQRLRITEDAPVGYWSSLPLNRMAGIARKLGQDANFSRDAGGFVCNHVFFTAARTLTVELPDSRFGFVHLPPISGPGEKLSQMVGLVRAWIDDGLA